MISTSKSRSVGRSTGTRINLVQQMTQENSLHALIPRPRIIPCPGTVTLRVGGHSPRCSGHSGGTEQGFSSPRLKKLLVPFLRIQVSPGHSSCQKNPTKSLGNPTAARDQLLHTEDVVQIGEAKTARADLGL